MDNETPARDDDPSEMTDFEKNATIEEREHFEQDPPQPDPSRPDPSRIRQERGPRESSRQSRQ